MPTLEQLSAIYAVDGDGSEVFQNDDGTTTTTWPDGMSRIDYSDGSATVTFPDFAVLNTYADGSSTLTDSAGTSLDPATGLTIEDDVPPPIGPDAVTEFLDGPKVIADANEARELAQTFADAVMGEVDPVSWFTPLFRMVLAVVKALETEERGCYIRGFTYTVMYSALDMGTPPEPTFSGGITQSADQAELDRQGWVDGVAAGSELMQGPNGVRARNRTLLRIATNAGDAYTTLREMYATACDASDDWQLKEAYRDNLGWPEPTGA